MRRVGRTNQANFAPPARSNGWNLCESRRSGNRSTVSLITTRLIAHLRLSAGRYDNGWPPDADHLTQDDVIRKLLLETKSGMTELVKALHHEDGRGASLIVSLSQVVIATRRIVPTAGHGLTLELDPGLDELYLNAELVDQRGPRLQWRNAETLQRVSLAP